MPAVKHLDHLNLSVRNFDQSADWYRRVFGFEVVEKGVYQGQPWGVLKGGDAMLCVYEHAELKHEPDADALANAGFHRIAHFGLRITDRAAWEATVKREGLTVHYGGAYEWPHSTSWYIDDPTGYSIEVALWNDDTPNFG
ncbi:MAG: VOC family protein [Planctomycetes bacterium]|nr:VOC family protein [Planctomycetota bacterium]